MIISIEQRNSEHYPQCKLDYLQCRRQIRLQPILDLPVLTLRDKTSIYHHNRVLMPYSTSCAQVFLLLESRYRIGTYVLQSIEYIKTFRYGEEKS